MSPMLFASAILEGRAIDVFNHGNMMRDFTYIDDIVEGVVRVLDKPAAANVNYDAANPDPASSTAPYRVFNIGNNQPVKLMDYIEAIERAIGMPATKNFRPMQPGDVPATFADTAELDAWVGFKPATPLADGVSRFVAWYREYYQLY